MKVIPEEAECDRILIVEGYSDLHFCAAFLRHLGRLEGVFIRNFGGKDNILKRIALDAEFSPQRLAGKRAIGILVDADDDPRGTAQSLGDLLRDVTGRELHEGEWSEGKPQFGFFVTPDGTNPGELETLVWNVWAGRPAHAAGKESVLTHLKNMEGAGWPAKSPDKARIGAFLAAAYDEDPRLGPGAREGLFDFDDPGFARLRRFLMEFTDPTAS
ncbi:MAG: hypothetical protein NTW21_04680 [Verrucomicrobia bacterium]|nr:hypothetical protein [Verrucomicrobiota bacterium]